MFGYLADIIYSINKDSILLMGHIENIVSVMNEMNLNPNL